MSKFITERALVGIVRIDGPSYRDFLHNNREKRTIERKRQQIKRSKKGKKVANVAVDDILNH